MFLRSLKLRGFKSFPDPVEVLLEPGVAIVVGPNGSGKSNIGDAIVWAAGSQSPSELRAERADDVLYAGSSERRAADYCEVELLFDNEDGSAPLPYSEISIARRLHRGGEGQYLVNRNPVRRVDLVELLADVGLGGGMHSIIGQGRVEQILSSKPAERRALVEEAAGLGKFKRRRHRAELKLARVTLQVERAHDLEDEVRKRLRPLALQASAAARAEKLGVELDRIRTRLEAAELERIERRLAEVAERRGAAERERRSRDERLEGVLVERHRAEEELGEAAGRHEEATAGLYRLRSAIERLELRRERAEEMVADLSGEAERLRRSAAEPRDERALAELAGAEEQAAAAADASRAALEKREAVAARRALAHERLTALDRSLAEQEGLPPAARALADAGAQLALTALEIDDGYDRAVAAALAWRAAAVLARDLEHALELAERARGEGLGALHVLLPPRPRLPARQEPPVGGAEPLARFARPVVGNERLAALFDDVWVVEQNVLGRGEHGVLVTREGHGYAPELGELWFAGEAAESVLLGLHARRSGLADEVELLERESRATAASAAAAAEAERAARERLERARAAAGRVPVLVDPRELERLDRLHAAAEALSACLLSALAAVQHLEAPLRARVTARGARSGELGEELRELGARESELRRAAGEAAELLAGIGIEAARLEAERDEVRERLPAGTPAEELGGEEEETLRATASRLERRREALGQVNPLAAEEHAAESARLGELVAQREDLERSLAELEKLRTDLTETVQRLFAETYEAVERNFAAVAATLFPGGRGRLSLTEDEEGDEPGVEIELQPAGKRVTRLSLLSGGEKALGAISFLFALFLARPCPFYLLDEVEAALDDTNIGRFVELLRSYAEQAQFIVVTHQKRTMEAADILYGVTMGADGISQIVSKRLAREPVHARSA